LVRYYYSLWVQLFRISGFKILLGIIKVRVEGRDSYYRMVWDDWYIFARGLCDDDNQCVLDRDGEVETFGVE